MIRDTLIFLAIAGILALLFSGRVRRSRGWRATVTPLASIIGSGFLVIAPLLAATAGRYSLLAIAALVGLGYLCGEVIRFNIVHIEPMLGNPEQGSVVATLERLSKVALGAAYIISVAFYLELLSAFLLRGLHIRNEVGADIVTTLFLLFIGIMGKLYGLGMLESMEEYSVSVKLAIIAGLLAGLAYFNANLALTGQWHLQFPDNDFTLGSFRTLLGALIVVQGFETSRFLGKKYDANERVRTMRFAQIVSGAIYCIFVALVAAVITPDLEVTETEIVDLSGRVSPVLPAALILAAAMSQFSASVADTVGAGGLLFETSRSKLSLRNSYLVIALAAVWLAWTTNVFEIISLASRAFALYYCLQALEAGVVAFGKKMLGRTVLFVLLSLFLLLITAFANPVGI